MIFVQRPLKSTSFGLEFENKIKKKEHCRSRGLSELLSIPKGPSKGSRALILLKSIFSFRMGKKEPGF